MSEKPVESGSKTVFDRVMSIQMRFFSKLVKEDPKLAEHLEDDFTEYIDTARSVHEELGDESSFNDIRARIPNNKWIDMLSGAVENIIERVKSVGLEGAREEARARLKKFTN